MDGEELAKKKRRKEIKEMIDSERRRPIHALEGIVK
jgi:hypothetical protein